MSCDGCGGRIMPDVLVSAEIWAQISQGDYALCALCMDQRLYRLGLTARGKAQFAGLALQLEVGPLACFRPTAEIAAREGPVDFSSIGL